MKVKELITKLLDYNMDAEVVTSHSETVEIAYICNDGEFDKADTPFVFIDGSDYDEGS